MKLFFIALFNNLVAMFRTKKAPPPEEAKPNKLKWAVGHKGTMTIFTEQTQEEFAARAIPTKYFWTDTRLPDRYYGPFASINDALGYHQAHPELFPVARINTVGYGPNVVEVNFVLKKRL